jgi:hypothetical protein
MPCRPIVENYTESYSCDKFHAMVLYREHGGNDPRVLDLRTVCRFVIVFTVRSFRPGNKALYPLGWGRMCGHQSWSERGEGKNAPCHSARTKFVDLMDSKNNNYKCRNFGAGCFLRH